MSSTSSLTLLPTSSEAPGFPRHQQPDFDVWTPTITHWVDAKPFAGLLRSLMADTGLPAAVIGVGLDISTRTIAGLLNLRANQLIRWCDAFALWETEPGELLRRGKRLQEAAPSLEAFESLPPSLRHADLLCAELGIDPVTAQGLEEGWLVECAALVNWRMTAFLEEWWASVYRFSITGPEPTNLRRRPDSALRLAA
jgi:hypothetical protein